MYGISRQKGTGSWVRRVPWAILWACLDSIPARYGIAHWPREQTSSSAVLCICPLYSLSYQPHPSGHAHRWKIYRQIQAHQTNVTIKKNGALHMNGGMIYSVFTDIRLQHNPHLNSILNTPTFFFLPSFLIHCFHKFPVLSCLATNTFTHTYTHTHIFYMMASISSTTHSVSVSNRCKVCFYIHPMKGGFTNVQCIYI